MMFVNLVEMLTLPTDPYTQTLSEGPLTADIFPSLTQADLAIVCAAIIMCLSEKPSHWYW